MRQNLHQQVMKSAVSVTLRVSQGIDVVNE